MRRFALLQLRRYEGGEGVLAAMTIERIGWKRTGTTEPVGIDVVTRTAALARSQSEEDTRADPHQRCQSQAAR